MKKSERIKYEFILRVVRLKDKEEIKREARGFDKIWKKGDQMFIFQMRRGSYARNFVFYLSGKDKLEECLPKILKRIEEFINKK